MKTAAFCGLLMSLAGAFTASASPVTVPNAGFETQTPELTSGAFTNNLAPWLETAGPNASAGFMEFITGFAAEGTDHLGMESGHDVWVDLGTGINFTSSTVYTLTVSAGNRAGQTAAGNITTYALTTSSGRIFATGSFDASTVPAGTFADAPNLTLDTFEEPAAVGNPIRILLRARGPGRSHFDNIRLDATATAQNGRPQGASSAATAVTASGATVGGSVSSIGSAAPSVTIHYGTVDAGSDPAAWQFTKVIPAPVNTGAFTTPLTGLNPAQIYYYRVRFTNASGSTWGSVTRNFTTLTFPAVVNLPATNFTPNSATAGARVTAFSGTAPSVTIYYGPADGGTTTANWAQSVSLGAVSTTASGTLTGLQPASSYFYRAFVSNTAGSTWAPTTGSFSTPGVSPPAITNRDADNITLTSARLNADVTSTGLAAPVVTFYYGTVDGGNVAASWSNSVAIGTGAGKVSTTLSSLTAGQTYFFRAAATNSAGTTWAAASTSFTTSIITPPVVRNLPATHVRSTMATLSGEVTATGNQTPTVTLYWGLTDGGTNAASWTNVVPLGTSTSTFSASLPA